MNLRLLALVLALCVARAGLPAPTSAAEPQAEKVLVVATPDGGIQPQAALDPQGNLHVVYFKGDPAAGDLYYVKAPASSAPPAFSTPVRVNSGPGSAIAVGTIRGAQLALGRNGLVHVAWNGSDKATPPNPVVGAPMMYARSLPGGAGFEPQRNLMTRTYHLDGGGSLAADPLGRVYVAWHGRAQGDPDGEAGRRLFVARSLDDGATFAPEAPALGPDVPPTGACACCGTRALADTAGRLYALYRAASGADAADRGMTLLISVDAGTHFRARTMQPWHVFTCPMSSESLTATPAGVYAAWETQGQVAFSRIDPQSLEPGPLVKPPGGGDRKHPSLAVNDRGEALLAWAEGTGWQRGGALVWRVFDPAGKPTRTLGRLDRAIPVWGLPAAVARPNGSFLVLH